MLLIRGSHASWAALHSTDYEGQLLKSRETATAWRCDARSVKLVFIWQQLRFATYGTEYLHGHGWDDGDSKAFAIARAKT